MIQLFGNINNKTKLKNILSKIQDIYETGVYPINYSVVFDIIKILADNINYRNNKALLANAQREDIWNDTFTNMIYEANEVDIKKEFIIEMGKHPVLTNVWNYKKQIDTLKFFSEEDNNWKTNPLNHIYYLLLPMGLTVIVNGFHSTNAGIVKSVGSLCFSPQSENPKVFDLAPLYESVFFDGNFYRETKTKKIKQRYGNEKGKSIFELGCIYEIGRIIHDETKKGHIINFPYRL